jgi:glycopeptide antibiotics resistance protein
VGDPLPASFSRGDKKVLEWTLPDAGEIDSPLEAARLLTKYGFYFSIFIFIYAVLFPFRFDLSLNHLSQALKDVIFIPYWDHKVGVRIVPDDLANILLTMPIGFTGFLHFQFRSRPVFRWLALGLGMGLAAEFSQLAILSRASTVADVIGNSLGVFFGAAISSVVGKRAMSFFTGTAPERRNIYLWMTIWCLVAMLGPFEFGPDSLAHFRSGLLTFGNQASNSESLYGEEWLRLAGFVLIGALAVRLAVPGRRKRTVRRPVAAASLVMLLPVILHYARLLAESRPPSMADLALNIFGILAGAFVSLFIPPRFHALSGFVLFTIALIVAGLSPFAFSGWKQIHFQWIPFYEFCMNRTPSSLYEVILSLVGFGILGGFLRLTFPRWRWWHLVVYAFVFSTAIEFAQMFSPVRTSGTGNILLAGIGAWAGASVCAAVQSARLNDKVFLNRAEEFSNYVM